MSDNNEKISSKDILDDLKCAFAVLQEKRKMQAEIIIKLSYPEDDFVKTLAQRFDKQRSKTNDILEIIEAAVNNIINE